MNQQHTKALIDYLAPYITEHKRNLMERMIKNRTRHCTIILENVSQPHNASAVLRSADCFGVQDVHIVKQHNNFSSVDGIAMGAAKWLTLEKHVAIDGAVSVLRKKGYRIIATTPHGSAVSLPNFPIEEKCAFLFGTELQGLSSQALESADEYITIPMFGFTESFNVSVSVALCLYDIITRLHSSDIAWQLSPQEQQAIMLAWYKSIIPAGNQLEKKFFSENELL